jgi:hypothetical protein
LPIQAIIETCVYLVDFIAQSIPDCLRAENKWSEAGPCPGNINTSEICVSARHRSCEIDPRVYGSSDLLVSMGSRVSGHTSFRAVLGCLRRV